VLRTFLKKSSLNFSNEIDARRSAFLKYIFKNCDHSKVEDVQKYESAFITSHNSIREKIGKTLFEVLFVERPNRIIIPKKSPINLSSVPALETKKYSKGMQKK
jgi:hypothetical protein